ncbi:MAG: hypothetical protein Kow0020_07850 [Wenzhouxiangellaceae bacterium]
MKALPTRHPSLRTRHLLAALWLALWSILAGVVCMPVHATVQVQDVGHPCPHCPDGGPSDLESDDCSRLPAADQSRSGDLQPTLAPAIVAEFHLRLPAADRSAAPSGNPGAIRAGPALHLLHLRFDE